MPARVLYVALMCGGVANAKFFYDGFTRHPFLNVVGDAAVVGDDIVLTPPENNRVGAAYFVDAQEIGAGFQTTFEVDLTTRAGSEPAGEGMAFVVQRDDPFMLGQEGPGMGYAGIQDGVAVELDLFPSADRADPGAPHVSVHVPTGYEGLTSDEEDAVATSAAVPFLHNRTRAVTIEYQPPNMIVYVYSPTAKLRRQTPVLTADVGIISGKYWVGFSAATPTAIGGSVAHVVLTWSFARLGDRRCHPGFSPVDKCRLDVANASSSCAAQSLCKTCAAAPLGCGWCAATARCVPATQLYLGACAGRLRLDPLECRVGVPSAWVHAPLIAIGVVAAFAVCLKYFLPAEHGVTALGFVVSLAGGALLGMALSFAISLALVQITQQRPAAVALGAVFFVGAIVVAMHVALAADSDDDGTDDLATLPPPELDDPRKGHRTLLLAAAALLLLAAALSASLDRLWTRELPAPARVILYGILGAALHFLLTYSSTDILHRATAACSRAPPADPPTQRAGGRTATQLRVAAVAESFEHVRVICAASCCAGVFFGLIFGMMAPTGDDSLIRASILLQRELIYAYPVGAVLGAASSLATAVISASHAHGRTVEESLWLTYERFAVLSSRDDPDLGPHPHSDQDRGFTPTLSVDSSDPGRAGSLRHGARQAPQRSMSAL